MDRVRAGDQVLYRGQRLAVLTEIDDLDIVLAGAEPIPVKRKDVKSLPRTWESSRRLAGWLSMPVEARGAALRYFLMIDEGQYRPQFASVMLKNLHVLDAAVEEVRKVRGAGHKRYSMRTIGEVIRHHSAVVNSLVPWKLNNNLLPDLARLMMTMFPELQGFFEVREQANRKETAA